MSRNFYTGSRLQLRGKDTAADSHSADTPHGAQLIPFPSRRTPNQAAPTGGQGRPSYSHDEPAPPRHWLIQLAIDSAAVGMCILFISVAAIAVNISLFWIFFG